MAEACCGFGHRKVFEDISEKLNSAVKNAAEQGCEIFYTGGMGDFDEMFSLAVRNLKKERPNIKLICIKPYMTKDINSQGDYLYALYDDVIIPTELADIHYKSIITKRNQWMIQNSNIVICYTRRNFGGAYAALKYTKKIGKPLFLI